MKNKMRLSILTLLLLVVACKAQQGETVTSASGVAIKRTVFGNKQEALPLPTSDDQVLTRKLDGSWEFVDPATGSETSFLPYKENTTTSFTPDYTVDNKDHVYLKNTSEITVSEPVNFVDRSGFSVEQDSTGIIKFAFGDIKGKYWQTNKEGALAIISREGTNWRIKCDFCEEYTPLGVNQYVGAGGLGSPDSSDMTGWGTGTATRVVNTSAGDVRTGTTSIKLTDAGNVSTSQSTLSVLTTATVGQKINYNLWAKGPVGSSFGIRAQSPITGVTYYDTTGSWVNITLPEITSDGGETRIYLYVNQASGQPLVGDYDVFIDDIQITYTD